MKFPTLNEKGVPDVRNFEYDKRPMWQKLLYRKKNDHKRGDIQAMRCFAVLAVLIYHVWPSSLQGGYVGVDVFFVISGFLISNQIVREFSKIYHKTRRKASVVGLKFLFRFYAARIRRLAPLSLTVLCVVTLAVHFLFASLPSYQDSTFQQVISSVLLMQNIRLEWNGHDYLHTSDESTAVNHFWSLSVEEQYYFIWPLLTIIILCVVFGILDMIRRRQTDQLVFVSHEKKLHKAATITLGIIVLLACIASFLYCLHLSQANPTSAYFSTMARMWELGIGSALTCIVITVRRTMTIGYAETSNIKDGKSSQIITQIVQLVGLGIVVFCAISFNPNNFAYPSAWTLLPVFGCFLFILAGRDSALIRFRPFQYIGDISYSLYLWHWALIVIVRKYFEITPDAPRIDRDIVSWAVIGASFLFSAVTYRIVETPFRKHFAKKNVHVYLCAVFVSAALLFVTVGINSSMAQDSKLPLDNLRDKVSRAVVAEEKREQNAIYSESDLCVGAVARMNYKVCNNVITPTNHNLAMVYTLPMGNNDWSMPYQANCFHTLYPERIGLSPIEPKKVCQFGNLDSDDYILLIGDSHAAHWSGAFDYVARQLGLKLVVATGMKGCAYYFEAVSPDCQTFIDFNEELIANEHAKYVFFSSNVQENDLDDKKQADQNNVLEKITHAKSLNPQTFVIEDVPNNNSIGGGSTFCILKSEYCTIDGSSTKQTNFFNQLETSGVIDEAHQILTRTRFCVKDEQKNENCYLIMGDVSVYYDELGHISDAYSKSLGPWMLQQLQLKGVN
jgi:peptidoglycan/LPS O-acetylase OafA/YrhL